MPDLQYFSINKFLWRWKRKGGAYAVDGVKLSFDAVPPPLPSSTQAKVEKIAKPPRQSAWDEMLSDFGKFSRWLDSSIQAKNEEARSEKQKVPPFDIQEIPAAMRKEMMPVGAKLMERWFAGRLNYSRTPADERAEIDQEGKPYLSDMYDTTTIRLDWVLSFPRAKEKYDYLISQAVRSQAARKVLFDKLKFYRDAVDLFVTDLCGDDPKELHKHFQFQRVEIDGTLSEKLTTQLRANIERFGVPDDLSAAIGSFNLYAAIGSVRLSRDYFGPDRTVTAEVTGVWVYVKDNYTFTDPQGERSQYLGHWSSRGVIVVPLDEVASFSSLIPYLDSPITVGNPVIKGEVYYPIHNSDFRDWAIKHQRGGDFIIFSDRRFVPIIPPITLYI